MIIAGIGISGNLGRPFCRQAIDRGHTVRCVAPHIERAQLPPEVELFRGSALDSGVLMEAFKGADVVVPVFPANLKNPWSYPDEHRNVIRCAKAAGVKRIVALLGSSGAKVNLGCSLVETDYFAETTRHYYLNIHDTWDVYRNEKGIEWAVIVPAARMQTHIPDRKTYRLRTDEYLVVEDEESLLYFDVSQISYGDCAKALLDEIETGAHSGCFVTVGY
ncbi:MAG: NAD(P)-dependent oxidoreductase [Oscillospiraceae bacterium]|jgi:putative NADH-flavin reductase